MNAHFTGRAGRIIAWLGQHPAGLRTSEVHQLEKELHPMVTAAQVAASLAQLFATKKVDRIGRAFHYTYLLPKRAGRRAVAATPPKAEKAKQYSSPLARAPKKESQPVVASRKATPRLKPRTASADAKPETVEEFLARGGRIQYCAHGERGFEPKSYQQQSQAHKDRMRAEVIARNKAKSRNQPAQNDDVDLDDVA